MPINLLVSCSHFSGELLLVLCFRIEEDTVVVVVVDDGDGNA